MVADPQQRPAWIRHARAAFVAFHLLAICALTTPDLGGTGSRKAWKQPAVQRELAPWAQRFDMSTAELEARLWGLAARYSQQRKRLLAPIQPYSDLFGVRQRWRMFASPLRVPVRFEFAIKRAGAWETIYVSRSSEHDWRRQLFDHDRLRSLTFRAAWPHQKHRYRQICNWVAKQAAADFPDATHARVRRYRYEITPPSGAEPKHEARYEAPCVRELEALR